MISLVDDSLRFTTLQFSPDPQWFSMILPGPLWFFMVLHGSLRFPMIPYDCPRFSTILHDSPRFSMILHDSPQLLNSRVIRIVIVYTFLSLADVRGIAAMCANPASRRLPDAWCTTGDTEGAISVWVGVWRFSIGDLQWSLSNEGSHSNPVESPPMCCSTFLHLDCIQSSRMIILFGR